MVIHTCAHKHTHTHTHIHIQHSTREFVERSQIWFEFKSKLSWQCSCVDLILWNVQRKHGYITYDIHPQSRENYKCKSIYHYASNVKGLFEVTYQRCISHDTAFCIWSVILIFFLSFFLSFFLPFFLGFRIPKLSTGLNWWCALDWMVLD